MLEKDVMARRAKNMATLGHLVDAYDTGGEAAFAAALDEPEPESRSMAYLLKGMAALQDSADRPRQEAISCRAEAACVWHFLAPRQAYH